MNAGVALDRDALYYPFIHITDVNWLKATLLCFPGVRRMVPQSYVPTDSDAVREFCDVEGPRGEPLLTRVDLFSPDAKAAEERLLATLEKQDSNIRSRFSERVTMKVLAPAPSRQRSRRACTSTTTAPGTAVRAATRTSARRS